MEVPRRYLSLDELAAVCAHIGMDDMSDAELETLFQKLDADRDGRVSLHEFTQVRVGRGGEGGVWWGVEERVEWSRWGGVGWGGAGRAGWGRVEHCGTGWGQGREGGVGGTVGLGHGRVG